MKFDLTIWLGIAFILSLGVNILLFWYLRKLMSRFLFISENLSDLVKMVNNYQNHLKEVYGLDMFYGDETLKHLMTHTKSLSELLEDYEDVYSIAIPLETQGEIDFDNNQEDTPTEEEVPTQQVSEENVFYAGSRKRNS